MKPSASTKKPKGKASQPLWNLLRGNFPDAECEVQFDWLFLPDAHERTTVEAEICEALTKHCRETKGQDASKKCECGCDEMFSRPFTGRKRTMEFDFYIPSLRLAIEFDERQHFTAERAVSLRLYGSKARFNYDIERWIAECDRIQAKDPDPPCRDWERAFRDSVRDIRATEQGISLLRIHYADAITSALIEEIKI